MTDLLDTVLGQAVVCAYAIPDEGAAVAAGVSLLQVVLDAIRPTATPPSDYSTAQALADLAQKIHDDLLAQAAGADLHTIGGWQLDVRTARETSASRVVRAADTFLTDHDVNKTFASLADTAPGSADRVKSLGTYFMARTTYHTLCSTWLHQLIDVQDRAAGQQPTPADVYRDIHTGYTDSLTDALGYARDSVAALDDAYQHARERAEAKRDAEGAPYARNAAFTAELRGIRAAAHTQFATTTDVADYRQFIELYDQTLAALTANPPPQAPQGRGTVTTPSTALGPRPPGVARFLHESGPSGGWVDVVADSPVAPGGLATQNAGSNLASIYYRFGGAPINGAFAAQLAAAGQLQQADADLATAYDARYGAGSHQADSTASPPRQDRLTTLLVPLSNGTPPVGDTVYAVLYSVGPQLGATGIDDPDGYRQIYADAFAEIADWNTRHPAIENVRLTLLSTGAFAGGSGGPALRAQAAGLVIDAAVAAVQANPTLATLQFLVNTNDAAGGVERIAFDTAARTRGITPTAQGFDVPLT